MRLGVDGWRVQGQRTGIGRYMVNVVTRWTREAIAERFDEVTFYAPQPVDRAEVPLPPGMRERVLPPDTRMLVWENVAFGPRADDDVLFCPSYTRPIVARGRTVVAIHDATLHLHPELYGRSAPFYDRLYGWSARSSTLVLTSTEAARQDIARGWDAPLAKIRVVPLAAADHFGPTGDGSAGRAVAERIFGSPAPYFLFVGKTSGRRRVPLLLESFARFRQETGPPHKLLLVGSKPNIELDDVIDRLDLGAEVRHSGFVSDGDLNLLYGAAEAVLCPSVYETVSLPIMEAQATGAPVVCVDSPGSREITGGHALFMPELTPATMAGAMATIARDAGFRRELRDAGLANSEQYSWDRTSRETLEVLAEAAASPRRPPARAR